MPLRVLDGLGRERAEADCVVRAARVQRLHAGAFAAWGSWTGAQWASVAALLYGATTAAMLVSLAPLLQLESEARRGIWTGALGVLLFSLFCAWYLRRVLRRLDRP